MLTEPPHGANRPKMGHYLPLRLQTWSNYHHTTLEEQSDPTNSTFHHQIHT
ncbi:hypothetical protein Hanom_Chr12g01078331 [Helianthus anomalus]